MARLTYRIPFFLFGLALVCLVVTLFVLDSYVTPEEQEARVFQTSPHVFAEAWAVFDPVSGAVLAGDDIDTPRPIASLTKLFTAYTVLYTESSTIETTITEGDIATHGDFGKLVSGEKRTLGSLLFPLLLESSNDAGAAIARTLGPLYPYAVQGIVDMIRLPHTRIVDATGLDPENVSTPRELALFFAREKQEYPHIIDITSLSMYVTEGAGLINNNPVSHFDTFAGGKQGYIPEAGKTFIGQFEVGREHRAVGIVLLHSTDLVKDVEAILGAL